MTEKLAPVRFSFNQDRVKDWDTWQQVVLPRLEAAAKLHIPRLRQLEAHEGHAIIVGAGPSVESYLPKLSQLLEGEFATLFSLNAAHNWLVKRNLVPSIHVVSEDDLDEITLALGGPPNRDTFYYLSSHCSTNVFRDLEGYGRVLWHCYTPIERYGEAIDRIFPGDFMVGGGGTTFFKTLTIAFVLGYRNFDLFGVDSSFEGSSHLDGYELSNIEPRINIWGSDPRTGTMRKFMSQGGLVFQATEFLRFCSDHQDKMKLCVHGDSLLRFLHESRYPEQYNPSTKGT